MFGCGERSIFTFTAKSSCPLTTTLFVSTAEWSSNFQFPNLLPNITYYIMRKVKIEFEFILDKDKFRFTKSIAKLRVFDGKKEFVIKYIKKN